ncbi:MAG: permease-like cell division protein FtsX [Acidimicrobiales bacterium]
MSSGYVVRETGSNLSRNLVMTVAAIVTMAVSLAALGGVLIMRQAINKASLQWKGGVELAIFLQPQVSQNESAAIGHELASMQGVKKYRYVDKPEAYKEFRQIFGAEPDLVQALNVGQMPPSYRVVPTRAQDIKELGQQFQQQPGVLKVSYAQQEINSLLQRFSTLRWIAVVLAIGVMVGAIALIVNTIQLAIFARRREVAVMKLVGATNWFIRIPFMLEGLVHGIIGAALAFLTSYLFRNTIASFVGNESILGNEKLYVTSHEAFITGLMVLLVGAAVGAIGSAFAVRRFLSV